MKIKYYKITKFNVVFNLKRMKNFVGTAEKRTARGKNFAREFNVFSCDNKKWEKNQRNKQKVCSTFVSISFFAALVHHWVNKLNGRNKALTSLENVIS